MRFKAVGFPKKTTLNHKNNVGCIDLEFENTAVTELMKRRQPDWPTGAVTVQTGKAAVIRLPVPRFDMDLPLAQQLDKLEEALAAAHKLIPLAIVMQK